MKNLSILTILTILALPVASYASYKEPFAVDLSLSKVIVQKAAIAAEAGLSHRALKLKKLFEELQGFKTNPDFLKHGFAPCCKYYDWKKRVEALNTESGKAIAQETGLAVHVAELLLLGMEYFSSFRNENTIWELEQRFLWTLSNHKLQEGEGRIAANDDACKSVQDLKAVRRAVLDQNYKAALVILNSPNCTKVIKNMIVTGPTSADGKYVQVNLPSGDAKWLHSSAVVFYRHE